MKRTLLVLAVIGFAICPARADTVLTFDPPQLRGGSIELDSYTQAGMTFTGQLSGSFSQTDTGVSGQPDDGTAHLDIGRYYTQLQAVNGSLFSLTQMDLAEYSTVFNSPQTIQMTGYRANNTSVSYTFTTDGIIDGTGPLADFQTATLPGTFTNLKYVAFNSAPFSIDNVHVLIVPEPSTFCCASVLMAFAMFYGWKRGRARRAVVGS